MIRYEIEKKLLSGELKVSEVKGFWNDCYKKYLNIDVPNDAKGVLQDVHWSFGGIGYFPTYSLGSFYAAQWHETINTSLNITKAIQSNSFKDIDLWHKQHIHDHGSLLTSDQLCKEATGGSLDFKYFEDYISKKFNL